MNIHSFCGHNESKVIGMLFWFFVIYSFLGFILEKLFARATKSDHQTRRGFFLFPLCPVYGLGMLAVLAMPTAWKEGMLLVFTGGIATTLVEYGVHWVYERFLGVHFWDYTGVFGNIRGRVCLPFTVAWGVLTALAVQWVHPEVVKLAVRVPPNVTYLFLLLLTVDAVCSAWALSKTGDPESLRWVPSTEQDIVKAENLQ